VLDAGGSPTTLAEQISWQRLSQAGIPMTSTNAVVTELIKVWLCKALLEQWINMNRIGLAPPVNWHSHYWRSLSVVVKSN
jgi:hypothetical protein